MTLKRFLIVLTLTVWGAILLGIVICEETGGPGRVRVVRRVQKVISGGQLPVTAAGVGRSLSASSASGWRVSFNSLGHRRSSSNTNNNTDGWTAVHKNQSTSASSTNASTTVHSSITNILPLPITETSLQQSSKKIQITKFGIGNIIRKGDGQSFVPIFTTKFPTVITTSTSEASINTEPPSSPPPRLPITKVTKNYIEIERGKKNGNKTLNVFESNYEGTQNITKNENRNIINQLEETGRGFMRRNGQPQQINPHQNQFQGQAQQQYLPLPQQYDGYIDPYHPVLQHHLNQPPHNPLQHQPPQEFHQHQHQHPNKKHAHHNDTSLLPMDKTLVYVSMIVTWIFWIVAFTTYYNLWGPHGRIHRNGGPIPNISVTEDAHGKQDTNQPTQPHVIHTR